MKRESVFVILWPVIEGQNDTLVKVDCYVLSIKWIYVNFFNAQKLGKQTFQIKMVFKASGLKNGQLFDPKLVTFYLRNSLR